jgi:hypothetical protein
VFKIEHLWRPSLWHNFPRSTSEVLMIEFGKNRQSRIEMPITVLLVEDSGALRLAIKRLLSSEPTIELLGEAVNLPQAFQMAAELRPNTGGGPGAPQAGL